ncbi:MAG: hypothetical protein LBC19_10665, partial [Tannerella sp.]|nr:hypothetical protein [Tannerella sp.]
MKVNVLLMAVLMTAFNAGIYSQDKLSEHTSMTAPVSDGNTVSSLPDKGRKVENGLFFTKSTYGNTDAQSDASSDLKGTKKLSKTF